MIKYCPQCLTEESFPDDVDMMKDIGICGKCNFEGFLVTWLDEKISPIALLHRTNGTDKGVKLDSGKLRWDLLPLDAIEGMVKILTFGAIKYTDNGWQEVDNAKERYYAAMMRHIVAWRKGENIDPESDLPHIYHAMTNMMFLDYFDRKENKCKN